MNSRRQRFNLSIESGKHYDMPPRYFSDEWKQLRKLNASNNFLCTLDERCNKWTKLKELYLMKNSFTAVGLTPTLFQLTTLTHLSLRQNKVEYVDVTSLVNLKHLWISFNKLKEVPNGVAKLKKLRFMDMSHNQITKLPDELLMMPKAPIIIAHKNLLQTIPYKWAPKLSAQRIHQFIICYNPLLYWPYACRDFQPIGVTTIFPPLTFFSSCYSFPTLFDICRNNYFNSSNNLQTTDLPLDIWTALDKNRCYDCEHCHKLYYHRFPVTVQKIDDLLFGIHLCYICLSRIVRQEKLVKNIDESCTES